MVELNREHLDKARAAIAQEEADKKLLNDRSGPPAPRPTPEFIEANIGKERTAQEMARAIQDRAKSYARNSEPAPEYVEYLSAKKRNSPEPER